MLTLLCHGCPLQAIVTAFGFDERTVGQWQARAGYHCQQVHQAIVEQGQVDLGHVQADYIERLNATFRAALAPLARRGRALAHLDTTLTAGMYLGGCAYNFCWHHSSLGRVDSTDGSRRRQAHTPAMATHLTDHQWTMMELLRYQVPLPPWVPPKRRGRPPQQAQPLLLANTT